MISRKIDGRSLSKVLCIFTFFSSFFSILLPGYFNDRKFKVLHFLRNVGLPYRPFEVTKKGPQKYKDEVSAQFFYF